jgi:hypothetical protein
MSACGEKALALLVRKAEGAWARRSERLVTIAFTDGVFPDYLKLPSHEAKKATHAFLRNAERAGAITIEWDRRAGEDGQITRLRLADPDVAAELLGLRPLWRVCSDALHQLKAAGALARCQAVYEAWCAGKAPRKLGPDRVRDFVDAHRVITACAEERPNAREVAVRRVSARLFADSKRVEAIHVALDLLTGSMDAEPASPEEVWMRLGLIKHPQPFQCAGDAVLLLVDGREQIIAAPYTAVAPRTVAGIRFSTSCRYVLTVENLTTFNELADGIAGPIAGLVLYCAGMPGLSFALAYSKVVAALPPGARLYHWGDIDRGGYRIAAALAATASASGVKLSPFRMNPAGIDAVTERRTIPHDEVRDMARIARSIGWDDEAAGVELAAAAYEQEAQPPELPN